jgi:hypothetical protein
LLLATNLAAVGLLVQVNEPGQRRPLGIVPPVGGTYLYIDGLNFYYGAVKGTPNKWLDLEALAHHLVPNDQITKIRYFTANVKQRWPGDRAHERQAAYLRAINASPLVEITYGHFRVDAKWRPLADQKFAMDDLFRPRLQPDWLARRLFERAKRRRVDPATQAHVLITEDVGDHRKSRFRINESRGLGVTMSLGG